MTDPPPTPRRPGRDPRRRPATAPPVSPGGPSSLDVRIELAGRTTRLTQLRARPQRYAPWFAAARRQPGHGICRCTLNGERLVIREVSGTFHLARWPRGGNNHRPGCPFSSASSSSAAAPAPPAITVTEQGIRITLDYHLSSATPRDCETAPPTRPSQQDRPGRERQHATMTGLGLLQWLWEAADLNAWPPPQSEQTRTLPTEPRPRRSWGDTRAALIAAMTGVQFGDDPALRLTHVVAPYRAGHLDPARAAELNEFLAPLENPEQTAIRGDPRRGRTRLRRQRRLLIGELKHDPQATAYGLRLALRHFPRPLFLTTELGEHLARTYRAAFASHRPRDTRRVLLALIEGSPHGHLRLVDAAALLTTTDYLPADSSHEALLAQHLVDAGREFTKPLRPGDEDRTLPDFVLTDTAPATVVEVWGLTGRVEYDQRRQVKLDHYANNNIPIIEWDVTTGPPPLSAISRIEPHGAPGRRGSSISARRRTEVETSEQQGPRAAGEIQRQRASMRSWEYGSDDAEEVPGG